jgi:hypothetical protein
VTSVAGVALLAGGASTASAGTVAAGTVRFWAHATNGAGTIVLTGAVGDYGKIVTIDKNGKTDANGTYVKVTLQHGSFEVNLTKYDADWGKVSFPIDKATCSSGGPFTGSVVVFNGSGLYKGISGTLTMTATDIWILARHNGKCGSVLFNTTYFAGTGPAIFS